jgi:hypothetical protein
MLVSFLSLLTKYPRESIYKGKRLFRLTVSGDSSLRLIGLAAFDLWQAYHGRDAKPLILMARKQNRERGRDGGPQSTSGTCLQ